MKISLDCCIICIKLAFPGHIFQTCLRQLKKTQVQRLHILPIHVVVQLCDDRKDENGRKCARKSREDEKSDVVLLC